MGSGQRRSAFFIAMPLIVAVGWLDYITGPDIGFSLFYLLPIAAVAWYSGRWFGVAAAVTAAACWQVADVAWNSSLGISLWNGFTRFAIYTMTAWLMDRVHADRLHMQSLNDSLEMALAREVALARTDTTTRLPNPRAFLEHLRSDLSRFAQAHCNATLLFLDLDNFKSVNDEYGHTAGDDALTRIAAGIQRQIRGADMAARMGGDEFVVLLWHADDEDTARQQSAIESVVSEVAADYPRSRLGVSIGVARIEDTTVDPEEIIRIADAAMYAMKAKRKNEAAAPSR
jgi:diguanylate cyclase (GGDEF)-like protein